MTSSDLKMLAEAVEKAERYEAMLEAAEGKRVYVYRCRECGRYAVGERKTRKYCEGCGR